VSKVIHDDAVCRKDLLRVLAEVNFIYGEVSISINISLDWVLSHWAHFTVHRFISVYVCVFCVFFHTAHVSYYCNTVVGPAVIEA